MPSMTKVVMPWQANDTSLRGSEAPGAGQKHMRQIADKIGKDVPTLMSASRREQSRVYNSAQVADMDQYRLAAGDKFKESQVRFATGVDYNAFLGSALDESVARLSKAPDHQSVDFRSAVANRTTWEQRPSDIIRLADDDTLQSPAKDQPAVQFVSLYHTAPQATAKATTGPMRGSWRTAATAVRVGGQFAKAAGMAAALATEAQEASNNRGRRWAAAGRKLTASLALMEARRLAPICEDATDLSDALNMRKAGGAAGRAPEAPFGRRQRQRSSPSPEDLARRGLSVDAVQQRMERFDRRISARRNQSARGESDRTDAASASGSLWGGESCFVSRASPAPPSVATHGSTCSSAASTAPPGAAAAPDDSWLQATDVLDIPTDAALAAMPLSDALQALREAERRLLLGLGAIGETWQERLKRRAAKVAPSSRKPALFEGRADIQEASAYVARRHEYHVRKVLELRARSRAVARRMEHAYATLADQIEVEKRFMQAQRLRLDKEVARIRLAQRREEEHMDEIAARRIYG
eukprot:jgi/Ulvmu1/11804/UM080_0015.1